MASQSVPPANSPPASTRVEAPWTPEQVSALNAWQACDWVHQFTCSPCAAEHEGPPALVATEAGFVCPGCGYRQSWAHSFMFPGPPPHPSDLFQLPLPEGDL